MKPASNPLLHRLRVGVIALIIALVVGFVTLEVAARLLVITNVDGQRFLLNLPLRPYHLPIADTQATVERYHETLISELVYDPLLGWTNRPNSPDYNSAGIRADREYASMPPDGVLRIAAFGDSFTHGNEVASAESWPAQLEALLNARGIPAEVLNFGVGGYGIDQAYLRWQEQGRAYHPDIVLLGFAPVDVNRLVTLYWKLEPNVFITPGSNPFSKPRYVLDGDQLRLINSPTVAPDDMPAFLTNFAGSDLARYEIGFDAADYQDQWWLHSEALAILDALRRYLVFDPARNPSLQIDLLRPPAQPAPYNDADQLTTAILQQWATRARADDSQFMVVHLPMKAGVQAYQGHQPLEYEALWRELSSSYAWIETLDAFPATGVDEEFAAGGHYSPRGSQTIAAAIADYVVNHAAD